MSDHPEPLKARELTEPERAQLVKQAFQLERTIKRRVSAVHEAWWSLAEALFELDEERGWELLGYDTLKEFLAQPEIGMSHTSFHRLVELWRELVEVRKVPPAGLRQLEASKAAEVLPAIRRGAVKVADALDDAKALGKRDLREKYRPIYVAQHGQKPDDSTPLAAEDEPERVPCQACGGSGWTTAEDGEAP